MKRQAGKRGTVHPERFAYKKGRPHTHRFDRRGRSEWTGTFGNVEKMPVSAENKAEPKHVLHNISF